MLDNEKAIKLTGNDRTKEIESRLADYLDSDLLNLFREANSWDGSFDFVDAFDADYIDDFLCDMKPYDIMCRVVFGNVDTVNAMLRFDAYGNLESVHEFELEEECKSCIYDMARWLIDDWSNVDGLYEEDKELFETWYNIDHDQYDCEEDGDE